MKRMIRSSIDLSTNERYQQLFADVFDVVKDRLIGSCLSATSMQQLVSGYNADWCSKDYEYDENSAKLERTADELIDINFQKRYRKVVASTLEDRLVDAVLEYLDNRLSNEVKSEKAIKRETIENLAYRFLENKAETNSADSIVDRVCEELEYDGYDLY